MRIVRAFALAGIALALASGTAAAASVLSITRDGGAPYFEGPVKAVSTNASIWGQACERVELRGRVLAGSATANSMIRPFDVATFECGSWVVSPNNVNSWTETFDSTAMTTTINGFEITGIGWLTCRYSGTLNATYTNPAPPLRAKIRINAGQTLSWVSGSFACAGTVPVTGTFDIATNEATVRDLYLVTR